MSASNSYRSQLADRLEASLGEGLKEGSLPRGAFLRPKDWLHVLEALRSSGPSVPSMREVELRELLVKCQDEMYDALASSRPTGSMGTLIQEIDKLLDGHDGPTATVERATEGA